MFILLMVAIPSFAGYYADRLLTDRLEEFHTLVMRARAHSMASDAPAYLVVTPTGIALEPRPIGEDGERVEDLPRFGGDAEGSNSNDDFFAVARGSRVELLLPHTLTQGSPDRWTFWPSGNCEPAVVSYKGPEGSWTLEYNPMSADYRLRDYAIAAF